MRTALRSKAANPRAKVVSSKTLPSPVGGWNARDSLAGMKPNEAVTLLNWMPKTSYCEMRGGYSDHATGLDGTAKTLAIYNAMNGSNKMFASTDSSIYDVTSAAEVGNYLSLAGAAGDYASSPDSAALDIVGDIDIRVRVAISNLSAFGRQTFVSKWTTAGNQRSYLMRWDGIGQQVAFSYSPDGIATTSITVPATGITLTNNEAVWLRMTYDVDNGAGGSLLSLYGSDDGVTWTLAATTLSAFTASFFAGTALLNVGSISAGTDERLTGKVYSAAIYNGIGGTLVASFDANDAVVGATSVTSSATSEVYTCNGTAVIAGNLVVASGVTSGKWQWVQFGDGTSNWLIMANGVDKPRYYNGTTWTAVDNASTPALTGLTTTNIISVMVFKGRLFFLQTQSLSFWYLNAGVAGGALTEFDLSAEATMGGYLMAMAHWSIDGGAGPEDRAVFITSEGEVIVYSGNNPSNSAAWGKVGTYYIGKPLGRRCVTQYGGDLVILTENGTYPLSAALQAAAIDYKAALSFLIETAFTEQARSTGNTFGWETVVYPAQSAMIVNVPITEGGEHSQYVMNTITKKWCEFDSWNAETFAVLNSELYFASGTSVYKAWTGAIDGTNNIVAYGKQAFSDLDTSLPKQIMMYRPVLSVNGTLSFLTDIDVDFTDDEIAGTAVYSVNSSGTWGSAIWGQSVWGSGYQITKEWTSPNEWAGVWISGKVKIATNSLSVRWITSDYIFQSTNNPMG